MRTLLSGLKNKKRLHPVFEPDETFVVSINSSKTIKLWLSSQFKTSLS